MFTTLKFFKIILFSLLAMSAFSLNVLAEEITDINSLIEDARSYDGQQVTIRGEAIGEVLVRGEFAWINVHDGTNAIGVWMPADEAAGVTTFGNYKNKGDILTIRGTFYRADPEHGGEADFHSSSLAVSEKGFAVKETVSSIKVLVTAALSFSALAFAGFFLWRRRQDTGI